MKLNNKTIFIIIFAIILIVVLAIVGTRFLKKPATVDTSNLPIEEKVKNGTALKQGNYELKDLKISSSGSLNKVTGKITNTTNNTRSAELKLLMSNATKAQLLGTSTIVIENIAGNDTKDFEISLVGSYSDIDTYEIRVNDYVAPATQEVQTTEPTE